MPTAEVHLNADPRIGRVVAAAATITITTATATATAAAAAAPCRERGCAGVPGRSAPIANPKRQSDMNSGHAKTRKTSRAEKRATKWQVENGEG